ncbi:MAG TPA: hypothetical protein ENJ43_02945 [Gammaproteobacteria bacterium]|nr:hypothetical protein [Gammaproteobacteria bacterium]
MKQPPGSRVTTALLAVAILLLPLFPQGIAAAARPEIHSGYYSRDGNDDLAAKTTGYSIYIKFYPDQWVIMLYVPYPYSLSVDAAALHKVFRNVKREARSKSYIRGSFGVLKEEATAHIETYKMLDDDTAMFECDGMAPCRAKFSGDTMEMIKAGMINNHIIGFTRVDD